MSLHLASTESDPYFQQVIVESSPYTLPYRTPINSRFLGDITTSLLKCPAGDLKCLRSRPAQEIVTAENVAGEKLLPDVLGPLHLFEPWGPVIDGKVVLENPLKAYRDGKFQKKPIMLGTVTEEGRVYIWEAFGSKPTKLEVDAFFGLIFGVETAAEIFKMYNFTDFDDLREPMSTAATDYVFACPTINASRLISLDDQNNFPVYHYIFDHALSFSTVWGPNYTECYGHVCHGSELPFVFRSISLRNYTFTKDEEKLADSITNYWGNFAYTGNPNNNNWKRKTKNQKQDFLKWPTYDNKSGWQGMLFQSTGNKIQSSYKEKFCQYFNTIGYTPR